MVFTFFITFILVIDFFDALKTVFSEMILNKIIIAHLWNIVGVCIFIGIQVP